MSVSRCNGAVECTIDADILQCWRLRRMSSIPSGRQLMHMGVVHVRSQVRVVQVLVPSGAGDTARAARPMKTTISSPHAEPASVDTVGDSVLEAKCLRRVYYPVRQPALACLLPFTPPNVKPKVVALICASHMRETKKQASI